MDQEQAIGLSKKYLNCLDENRIDFEKIYLYGSFATGNQTKFSDIDLAIIMKKWDNHFDMQNRLLMLTKSVSYVIEPHPFLEDDFTEKNPIAKEILKRAIRIK